MNHPYIVNDTNGYQVLAMRTRGLYTSPSEQIICGSLGLCGESAELLEAYRNSYINSENVEKEIGDCFWYVALICDANNWDCLKSYTPEKFILNYNPDETIDNLIIQIGLFADNIKKIVYHSKNIPHSELKIIINSIITYLIDLAYGMNLDIIKILQMNINKLVVRYPKGFTYEAANKPRIGE